MDDQVDQAPNRPVLARALSAREAADYIGVSRATIYSLAAQAKIRHFRPGGSNGRIMFRLEHLDEYIQSCTVEVGDAPPRRPPLVKAPGPNLRFLQMGKPKKRHI